MKNKIIILSAILLILACNQKTNFNKIIKKSHYWENKRNRQTYELLDMNVIDISKKSNYDGPLVLIVNQFGRCYVIDIEEFIRDLKKVEKIILKLGLY